MSALAVKHGDWFVLIVAVTCIVVIVAGLLMLALTGNV